MEGDAISGEMVAVATGSGVVEVAMATTEEDINATSAKLLITEVPTCGFSGLSITLTVSFDWLSVRDGGGNLIKI